MTRRWQPWVVWTGRIVSCAPVAIVLMSARWKLTHDPWYVQEFGRIGWPVGSVTSTIPRLRLHSPIRFDQSKATAWRV